MLQEFLGLPEWEVKRAYIRLFKYCSNKKFDITSNFFDKSDVVGRIAVKLNDDIDSNNNINIFLIDDDDKDGIRNYEGILSSHHRTYFSNLKYTNIDLDGFGAIPRDADEIDPKTIDNLQIEINPDYEKMFLTSTTKAELISSLEKIGWVQKLESSHNLIHFFCVTEINIYGDKRLIISHFLYLPNSHPGIKIMNFAFVAFMRSHFDRIKNQPARLFLNLLYECAVPLKYDINSNKKKLLIMKMDLSSRPKDYSFLLDLKSQRRIFISININTQNPPYHVIYSVDFSQFAHNNFLLLKS